LILKKLQVNQVVEMQLHLEDIKVYFKKKIRIKAMKKYLKQLKIIN
jgi:hypothetical protein